MRGETSGPVLVLGVTVGMSLVHHLGLPENLREDGWRVVVVTTPSAESQSLRDAGFEVVDLPMERNPSPLADVRALRAWLKVLGRIRPDVVLIGTPKASLLGLVAAWLRRTPVRIYMLHGLRLETSSGVMLFILKCMEQVTARASTHVLAVSESLKDRAVALGLVPEHKVRVLGSGSSNGVGAVPEDLGQLQRGGHVDAAPVIGFVGRINVDKGFADLLAAFDLLEEWGVPHASLVAGAPEGVAGEELLARYTSSGSQHTYVGLVDDVGAQYARMSVLVLPSYREGLGMVVLEAAAWGVPSVVSNATGVRDSVVDGVTGWTYPVGDVEALANALRRVLHDPAELRRRGAAARERVISDFSRTAVQTRLINFIEGATLR